MENQALHVLLVEDNPSDARLIAAVLAAEADKGNAAQRYDIERVDRMQPAIERVGQGAFDVVLLDLSLPDSLGINTIKRMLDATKLPILILSGQDDENLAIQAVQEGAQDYLVKGQGIGSELTRAIRYAIERKRGVERLRESEERFRLLAENSADLVTQISADFKYLYVSPSYKSILGYDAETLQGGDVQQYIHPDDLPDLKERFLQAVSKKAETFEAEYRIRRQDAEFRWLEARCKFFYDDRGIFNKFQIHSRDVTERKQMEERIQASVREKDALLKEVHHRVKNNMQVIVSLINLQFERTDDKHVLELLKESRDRIFSMALVHEMLYKSDDLSSIRFDAYLSTLAETLFDSYGANDLDVGLELNLRPVSVAIEEAIPCGLMVQEMLSNALKYAFPAGWTKPKQIRIFLDEKDGEIRLSIGDNGVGLGGAEPPKKSLGLQLVDILSEQLKARVTVQSGDGTRFDISMKKNL